MDSTELASIRADELATFTDTGVRMVYTEGTRSVSGKSTVTWPDGDSTTCLVLFTSSQERRGADIQPVSWDAIARLPHDFTIAYRDKFRLTRRFGVALAAAVTFQVVGHPQPGLGHVMAKLQQVTP